MMFDLTSMAAGGVFGFGIGLLVQRRERAAQQVIATREPVVLARPTDLPLDMAGDLGDLMHVPFIRLDPVAARFVELERERLKPRPLAPW